jgi:glycosyltransferase involved in cell wall biosynthesis
LRDNPPAPVSIPRQRFADMKLSIIVPAYNEAKRIESCLQHLSAAVRDCGRRLTAEMIVVDNNSTDATPDLARKAGARVVFEPVNQIARARNIGAAAALGDWFLFVDADTLVSAETLAEMFSLIDTGKFIGGAAILRYDRTPPFWKSFLFVSNRIVIPLMGWTAGCFMFCRSDAFREFGGFDPDLFAGEDVEFGKAMRRWGKPRGLGVAILRRHPPITSIRKIELYGSREIFLLILRWLLFPQRTGRDKTGLGVFYDGRR